jgi:phospholipase D1/2
MITVEGRNCWRKTWSKRVSFLVDGAAYFSALAEAVERAESCILMLGWDFDSRTRLRPDAQQRGFPDRFAAFLTAVLSRRPELYAHILGWDFAMIYALEREPLPLFKFGLHTHRRLDFRLDRSHPFGGSHHQKIVVIDDSVAFVGGLDITKRRWDTPEHKAHDPRRIDPGGIYYPPFHDIQVMVDGETARSLGELARRRWFLATGNRLPFTSTDDTDPWPPATTPDIEDVQVAISRTEPAYAGRTEVREVELLFLDAIAAARETIYIENQYFTSVKIAEALAARLSEKTGPEIIIVTPREPSGLLEETTMGVLRARIVQGLKKKDVYDHLRVFYPVVPDLVDGECLNVHSKVMIADSDFLRIGSANLSNRSMGLDTECDISVEADGAERVRERIRGFRNALLGEHLGVPEARVAAAVRDRGSILAAVDMLRGGPRTMEILENVVPEWLDDVVPDATVLDPERPIDSERLLNHILTGEEQPAAHPVLKAGALIALFLLVAVLWRYGPLREWFDLEHIEIFIASFRSNVVAPFVVIGAFVVGGFLVVPLTVLIIATAFVFDPLPALFYAMSGALTSSAIIFAVGRYLGRDTVRRFAGARLNAVSRRLGRRGILAVVIVRLLPILPFTIINLVAGASQVKLKEFLIGSAIGLSPGIITITLFEKGLEDAIRRPGFATFAVLAAIVIITLFVSTYMARRMGTATNPKRRSGET